MTTENLGMDLPGIGSTGWGPKLLAAFNVLDGASKHLKFQPERYDAVGDGVANDTDAIAGAVADIDLAGSGTLWLDPDKVYLVDVDSIPGCANLKVLGGGTLKVTDAGGGAIFTCTGNDTVFFGDVKVEAPNDLTVLAHLVEATTEVDFLLVGCTKARLYATNPAMTYAAADTGTDRVGGNVCRNVRSFFCSGVGPGAGSTSGIDPFIWARYVVGGCSIGDRATGYASGWEGWGGNANTAVNGAIANKRKAGPFEVVACDFSDMDIGGAWASMCYGVNLQGHVERCNDVGFDFEGCVDCHASGSADDCTNGGIACFYLNRGLTYDVAVSTSASAGYVASIKNDTLSKDNRDITVRGSFSCSSGVGLFLAEVVQNLVLDITVDNVKVKTNSNNQGDNTLTVNGTYTRDLGAGGYALDVGQTHERLCVVKGTLVADTAQHSTARALNVQQVIASVTDVDITARGWGATPIRTHMTGFTAASQPVIRLAGNIYEGTGIDRVESGTGGSFAHVFTKLRNASGTASIPSATPTGGGTRYDAGQVVYFGAPTAGGFIGAVCVTAGSPGTWKNFGAISA